MSYRTTLHVISLEEKCLGEPPDGGSEGQIEVPVSSRVRMIGEVSGPGFSISSVYFPKGEEDFGEQFKVCRDLNESERKGVLRTEGNVCQVRVWVARKGSRSFLVGIVLSYLVHKCVDVP